MKQGLFQEKAMQQLAVPEQLDQRVRIIPSGAWILFAAVLTGIAAAVMWAFFGTVSSGADYHGVIFDYNDVISLRAQTGGVLGDVLVEEGDTVSRGDVIAVIYNEAALQRIETCGNARKAMRRLRKDTVIWRRRSAGSAENTCCEAPRTALCRRFF